MPYLTDEPDKPGTPEIVDWDKDHVDLKWDKPIKDGGAPITGYVIEKREVGSPKWTKACEVRCFNPRRKRRGRYKRDGYLLYVDMVFVCFYMVS